MAAGAPVMRRRVGALLAGACLFVAAGAWAREADGSLGNIVTPNEGRPAVVRAGEALDVALESEARLALVGPEELIPLQQEVIDSKQFVIVRVTIPEDAPVGAYALEAEAGDARDVVAQAVWVIDDGLATYTVALLAEPRIDGANAGTFRDLLRGINASEAALVLVIGNLTSTGAAAEFQVLIDALGALDAPAYVCPGPNDRRHGLYEAFFGPMPYAFWFGSDGYLAVDTSLPAIAVPRDSGDLYRLRRGIRSARWSTGFTYRYTPAMPLRDQVTLLVDDPLDVIAFGREDTSAAVNAEPLAVGRVPYLTVPPAAAGYVQFVQVTATEPQAGEAMRLEGLELLVDGR